MPASSQVIVVGTTHPAIIVQGCVGLRARVIRAVGIILMLVGLNAATWVLQGGRLAWETHLGGFLAGLALTLAWRGPAPEPAGSHRDSVD